MTKSCNNPIARRIIQAASAGGRIRLIVDVTPLYGDLKLFTVSIAYRRRAVPLVWKVIDKAGVTDAATQIELLGHLVPLGSSRERKLSFSVIGKVMVLVLRTVLWMTIIA